MNEFRIAADAAGVDLHSGSLNIGQAHAFDLNVRRHALCMVTLFCHPGAPGAQQAVVFWRPVTGNQLNGSIMNSETGLNGIQKLVKPGVHMAYLVVVMAAEEMIKTFQGLGIQLSLCIEIGYG